MVDAESIRARIAHLDQLLVELDSIRADGRETYMTDRRTRLAAEHALQLAIQACIDIGAHLIAELGMKAPDDYRGVFDTLCDVGLDADLAVRLAAASGMRNILVHGYLDVDAEAVWNALDQLDDLRSFARFGEQTADADAMAVEIDQTERPTESAE